MSKKPNASRLVALAAELSPAHFVDAIWHWRDTEHARREQKRHIAAGIPFAGSVAMLHRTTAPEKPEFFGVPVIRPRAVAGGKRP